jgi:uncharacterized repeat protein (TIGR03803 family)
MVLYSFRNNAKNGNVPQAGLIFDGTGKLYGTTRFGGAYNVGTVFELAPKVGGGWTQKILHDFNSNDGDGFFPTAALIFDAAGDLYGTTYNGGTGANCDYEGCGTVFELMPQSGGTWAEKILHSFNFDGRDGIFPIAGLIFGASGNIYGTTTEGGTYNPDAGTVFELTPKPGGWTEKVVHSFGSGKDGFDPFGGLITDAAGNLYGTTATDGGLGYGTVFELSPRSGGGWTEKVLHRFTGYDGASPGAALIFDTAGDLYGTTFQGGSGAGFGTPWTVNCGKPR